ncbi:MAG: hypothetical protein MUF39_04605 [Cyclobacteriaceae bacterium]|nr:hypothetical protein [Cyclobacteriaceae bacterium]
MNSLSFWKSWSRPYQLLFGLLTTALLFFIGYFWYSYYVYPAPFITWDQFQQLNIEETPIRSFTKAIFQVPVLADNFLIFEILSGSEPQPAAMPYYLFLIAVVLTVTALLAIISSLSRYWYIIGMGFFSLYIMLMPLDTLGIAGMNNKIPAIAILLLFGVLSYFFHAIQSHHSYVTRFLAFAGLMILTLLVILQFSSVQDPLLLFAANGYMLAVILTIAFILTVAHEIPVAFINVISRGSRQTKSLQHFILISVFYLINLFLTYGIKIGYLSINLWTVDLYFLLTISSLLSIWGFRQREAQYESFFPADPVGVYYILSLGLTAFASLGYFMATANDTILIVLKDVIIYSHLGYGIIFLFYVFANFGSMLTKNLQVYKVLYKPNTMPHFTFRLMGLICTFGFLVFDTNWRTPINQAFASYYNSYGDIYLFQEKPEEAEAYYKKSIFFRNQNHHAHYALAALNAARLEPRDELSELVEASESHAPEQTLINLTDAYRRSGKTAEALLSIERASIKSSHKSALYNAKGLIYLQLNMSDSSLLSFKKAREENYMKEIAETNLLAASARFKLSFPADSLLLLLKSEKEGPKTNALALANIQLNEISVEYLPTTDTILSATRAAFLCNYILNQRSKIDTTVLSNTISLARRPSNEAFREHILISAAHAYYLQGRVKYAFELAREVAYRDGKGKYFFLLGTWALEQDNPSIAAEYFAIAKEKNHPQAAYNEAIAIIESGNLKEAKIKWNELLTTSDTLQNNPSNKIIRVIDASTAQILKADDESKYLYCRYNVKLTDTTTFKLIVNNITNEEFKIKALLEYAEKWYALDEPSIAVNFVNMADGLTPQTQSTLAKFFYLNGMLLSEDKNWSDLRQLITNNELLKNEYPNQVLYWQALLHQQDGDIKEAGRIFTHLGNANMYFDEGVVAAADYAMKNSEDPLVAYTILINGLMARPNSVKLLKGYIKQAALIGFDEIASDGLDKLKGLISPASFNRFINENPDYFSLE